MDRLVNTVRPYAWGSVTAIPELLGQEPTGSPQAELWMGAHPGAPSRTDRGDGPVPLDELIAADPQAELGAAATARFGTELPFLFKVLAAGIPLSIQAHPTLDQARAGFAGEQARGIPLDAAHRNYRDANHKPELICALDEFDGLCGFRRPADAAALMAALDVPGLTPLIEVLRHKPEAEALREVLADVLSMDEDTAAGLVRQAAAAVDRAAAADPEGPYGPYTLITREFPGDVGLLAGLLLNHVRLQPGEALYLGAGVPHAYLHGTAVELMANSDNVLRAGLTPKHIDVPELLKVVVFAAADPDVLHPVPVPGTPGEALYPVPIDEFRLSRFDLGDEPRRIDGRAPQIVLCTVGTTRLTAADGRTLDLARGESAFLPATGTDTTLSGPGATLFRATVTL